MASRGDIKIEQVQPKLFKNWVKLSIDQTIDKSGSFVKLKSKDYFENGDFPVVDQGDKFVSGYVNDQNLLYQGELPVIIFGDHTRNIKFIDFPFAVGADGTKILRPKSFYNPKFYHYYFKSLRVPDLGYSRHFSILKEIEFPLPPLAEQNRIVDKLDRLFNQLEIIKVSLANIPLLLKDFRQQVLTQAVTGKLTEEWRKGKDLTSLSLINKLKSRHSDIGGHKKGNAANHDIVKHQITFIELPNSWNVLEMKYICKPEKPITYGILMPGPEIIDGKPYLKVMSYPNNCIDFTKIRHTSDIIEANFKRSRLSYGDIVLSIRGTVGRIIIIPEVLEGANLTQDSARLSIQNGMNNFFVAIVLKSKLLQDVMDSVTKGVAVRGINIGDVRHLRIPIPDLIEQNEIVSRVESLFAKADAIEQQYKTIKEKIDILPQALLHKVFKGELTEQLDSDGDARELLQQIQVLKEEQSKKGKIK